MAFCLVLHPRGGVKASVIKQPKTAGDVSLKGSSDHQNVPGVQVIFGGAGDSGLLNDVWVFDTQGHRWQCPTVRGPAPIPREMHTATTVSPTELLVFGGRTVALEVGPVIIHIALPEGHPAGWGVANSAPPSCVSANHGLVRAWFLMVCRRRHDCDRRPVPPASV